MKKTFISVILIALLCLSACSNNNTLPKQEQNVLPSSKDSVDEFMILLKQMQSTGYFNEYKFDEKFCYNVTTDNILSNTNAKIFKFSDSCASFIMIDENIYELCQSFGGYGFINAVPCDFDNDDNKDLLISSSYGSGIHHSVISIFNTNTKQSTIIYDASKAEKTTPI